MMTKQLMTKPAPPETPADDTVLDSHTSPTASTADDSLDPVLARLAASFAAAGYQLYLVGGAVRDRLLGRPSPDLDLTTDAVPAAVRRLARDVQPDAMHGVGEKFGTIGLVFAGRNIEITTFRGEQYERGSRKPRVQYGVIARRGPGAAGLHYQRHGAGPRGRAGRPVWRAGRPAGRADSRRWGTPRAVCRRPAAAAAGGALRGPVGVSAPPGDAAGHPHGGQAATDDQPRARGRRVEQDSGVAAPGTRRPPRREPRSDAVHHSRRC